MARLGKDPSSPGVTAPYFARWPPHHGGLKEIVARGGARWSAARSIGLSGYDHGIDMDTVTISPKFQVVLPRRLREEMGLKAGGKMRVIRYGDRIELLPARKASDLRGFLKGMDTSIPRDRDRV